jgi:hypothetical protein
MGYGHNIVYELKKSTATTIVYPVFLQTYTTSTAAGAANMAYFNQFNLLQALMAGSTDGAGVGDITSYGMVPAANLVGLKAPKTGLRIVVAVKKPGISPDYITAEKVSNATGASAMTAALVNSTMLNASATTGCQLSSDAQLMKIALSASDTDTLGMLEVKVGVRDSSNRTAWVWDPVVFNVSNTGASNTVELNIDIIRKTLINNTKIDTGLNTYTVFDDDGITPVKSYSLYDEMGDPSSTSVFERRLIP